jgi:hypothetical protein
MVTIVIPTIGRASIEAAVNSVYQQTVPAKLLVMYDGLRSGATITRNRAIPLIDTEWTGFLDDDDTLNKHYCEWLVKETADVVVFKMHRRGIGDIPKEPKLVYERVGISYAIKSQVFRDNPFPPVQNGIIEDFGLLKILEDKGYSFSFPNKVAYYVLGHRQ